MPVIHRADRGLQRRALGRLDQQPHPVPAPDTRDGRGRGAIDDAARRADRLVRPREVLPRSKAEAASPALMMIPASRP
jgi:hypothetical protein